MATVAERLARRSVERANGRLEWSGCALKDGYGLIRVDGKTVLTHRLAWELANGPIPDGLHVLHHCDNPPCRQTEPTEGYPEGHLFLGTNEDNVADKMAKGRHASAGKTCCVHGHRFDEANTYHIPEGGRGCRTCRKAAYAKATAKRDSL